MIINRHIVSINIQVQNTENILQMANNLPAIGYQDPEKLTIFDICDTTTSSGESLAFLQNHNLLRQELNCPQCGQEMALENDRERIAAPFVWRCGHCRTKRSILDGSFFTNTKIPMRKHITMIYYWASETPVHVVVHHLDLDEKTVIQWDHFLRDICSWKLLQIGITLGGAGVIVQVDESVLVKAKYYRGRNLNRPQHWVFGCYDTTSKLGYICFVQDRSGNTLLPIIQRYPHSHV